MKKINKTRSSMRGSMHSVAKAASAVLLSAAMAATFTSCAPKLSAFAKYKPLVELAASSPLENEIADSLFKRVNGIRKEWGLEQLNHDTSLMMFAIAHSVEMGVNDYVSHYDWADRDLESRVEAGGLNWRFEHIGENCAFTEIPRRFEAETNDSERKYSIRTKITELLNDIVNGWMVSAGHRGHILDKNFLLAGMGVYIECDSSCCKIFTSENCKNVTECCKVFVTQAFSTSEKGLTFTSDGKVIFILDSE